MIKHVPPPKLTDAQFCKARIYLGAALLE
jgi:hypothetical protein